MNIEVTTTGLHHITLRASDLSRSKKFYCELLGFKALLEKENLLIVQVGDFALAIRGAESKTPPGDGFDPFRIGLDHLALSSATVEEIERVARLLRENGVWTEGPKIDTTLGKKYVAFKDPDGIKLELYEG